MLDYSNNDPQIFTSNSTTSLCPRRRRSNDAFAHDSLLPPVSRTRVAVTTENARSAIMGELSAVGHAGLGFPSSRMVCLGIFVAAFAYSIAGCLGDDASLAPAMAPKEIVVGAGSDDSLNYFTDYNGGWNDNFDNNYDDNNNNNNNGNVDNDYVTKDKEGVVFGTKEFKQKHPKDDLSLEILLKRKAVSAEIVKYLDSIPPSDNIHSNSKYLELSSNKIDDLHSSKYIPLTNLIVNSNSDNNNDDNNNDNNNNAKIDTEVLHQESTSFKEEIKDIEKERDDSSKRVTQNTDAPSDASVWDYHQQELNPYLRPFEDDDNNSPNETFPWEESPLYNDLTSGDNIGDNSDNNDNNINDNNNDHQTDDDNRGIHLSRRVSSLHLLKDTLTFFTDHSRKLYDYFFPKAVGALDKGPVDSGDSDTSSSTIYLVRSKVRSKRTARSRSWEQRRQRYILRRQQQLRNRLSITYNNVVPCAHKDRFYCQHGGTCVWVGALGVKSCRCNVGYTGTRCHLVDSQYLLDLLRSGLITSRRSRNRRV